MRRLAPLTLCALLAALAGCGGDGTGGGGHGSGGGGSGATRTADPPVHLGCHRYCRQARPDAGGAGPGRPMVTLDSERAVTPHDGRVPVTLTCDFDAPCRGALLLAYSVLFPSAPNLPSDVGRSDLALPAHGTRTISVPLTPYGRRRLEQSGYAVVLTADSRPSLAQLPPGRRGAWSALAVRQVTVGQGDD